jgi:hypothetical protein
MEERKKEKKKEKKGKKKKLTSLQIGRPRNSDSIRGRSKRLFSASKHPRTVAVTQLPIQWVPGAPTLKLCAHLRLVP